MVKEYIQLGDAAQCADNGISRGNQYAFGIKNSTDSRFRCKNKDNVYTSWSVRDKYRTNFKLTLIISDPDPIPF